MLSCDKIWSRPEGRPSPSLGLEGSVIQQSGSGLHLERTLDSFSPYQYLLHFPMVVLDSKAVIVKTGVLLFTSEYKIHRVMCFAGAKCILYISPRRQKIL